MTHENLQKRTRKIICFIETIKNALVNVLFKASTLRVLIKTGGLQLKKAICFALKKNKLQQRDFFDTSPDQFKTNNKPLCNINRKNTKKNTTPL